MRGNDYHVLKISVSRINQETSEYKIAIKVQSKSMGQDYRGKCCYKSYDRRDSSSHAHNDEDHLDGIKHGDEGGQIRHSQRLRFMRDLTGLILIYMDHCCERKKEM